MSTVWSLSWTTITTAVAQNKAAPMNIMFQPEETISFSSLLSQKHEGKKNKINNLQNL